MIWLKDFKIIGKIVRINGSRAAGHYVGEEFNLTPFSHEENEVHRTPGVCGFLYHTISIFSDFTVWWNVFRGKVARKCFLPDAQIAKSYHRN